jgi:hypothetical protein
MFNRTGWQRRIAAKLAHAWDRVCLAFFDPDYEERAERDLRESLAWCPGPTKFIAVDAIERIYYCDGELDCIAVQEYLDGRWPNWYQRGPQSILLHAAESFRVAVLRDHNYKPVKFTLSPLKYYGSEAPLTFTATPATAWTKEKMLLIRRKTNPFKTLQETMSHVKPQEHQEFWAPLDRPMMYDSIPHAAVKLDENELPIVGSTNYYRTIVRHAVVELRFEVDGKDFPVEQDGDLEATDLLAANLNIELTLRCGDQTTPVYAKLIEVVDYDPLQRRPNIV